MNGGEEPKWARNRSGTVVHRLSCRHGRIPWVFADYFTEDQVAATVAEVPWLRFGACCTPTPSPVSVLGEIEARHAHPAGGQ